MGPEPEAAIPSDARRLVVVATDGFDSNDAQIATFVRETGEASWRQVGSSEPARVGRAGVGWGYTFRNFARADEPLKREGDKRAPAGLFRLGATFGDGLGAGAGHMQLTDGQHFCVDDTASESYSEIVPLDTVSEGTSGEKMWAIDLYRRGIVVDYPTSREAKSGSCIFIHVWRTPDTPTAGCVAASEETVKRLQDWTQVAEGGVYLAIVPQGAAARLGLQNLSPDFRGS